MFIKLTEVENKDCIRININNIITYKKTLCSDCTLLLLKNNLFHVVEETPEEIDEMVKKCLP